MNLINHNSDNQNEDMNTEKVARSKFIVISIFLVLFMFGSIIIPSILHKILFEEILLLNQQSYGTLTIVLWLPFFLFSATIVVLGRFLDFVKQDKTEEVSQNSIFRDTLRELCLPSQKKIKKKTLMFWTLLILSFLSFIASQLFLYLGIIFLI